MLDAERADLKSFSMTSSALSLIMSSMLSLFEFISRSLSVFLEDIKLIVIVNWTFRVSDFLRSFMISFKYVLILLRYPSIDSVLPLFSLLSYSI